MAFVSASVPWAEHLRRLEPAIAQHLHHARGDLGELDLWGDEEAGVLHAEVPGAREPVDAAWTVVRTVAAAWPGWPTRSSTCTRRHGGQLGA